MKIKEQLKIVIFNTLNFILKITGILILQF